LATPPLFPSYRNHLDAISRAKSPLHRRVFPPHRGQGTREHVNATLIAPQKKIRLLLAAIRLQIQQRRKSEDQPNLTAPSPSPLYGTAILLEILRKRHRSLGCLGNSELASRWILFPWKSPNFSCGLGTNDEPFDAPHRPQSPINACLPLFHSHCSFPWNRPNRRPVPCCPARLFRRPKGPTKSASRAEPPLGPERSITAARSKKSSQGRRHLRRGFFMISAGGKSCGWPKGLGSPHAGCLPVSLGKKSGGGLRDDSL